MVEVVSHTLSQEIKPLGSNIEAKVRTLETKLGLNTPLERAVEGALLVDFKFIQAGVIRGDTQVQQLFGENAWADWLNAREFAKSQLGQPLTPELIIESHKRLTAHSNPDIGGLIREGECIAGDYKYLGEPAQFTNGQILAIDENPYLDFLQAGDDPNQGLIIYPNSSFNIDQFQLTDKERQTFENGSRTTEALLEILLAHTCDWYNNQVAQPGNDPYYIAAELQRRLISVHGFHDINGRTSRLWMNWSLESAGLDPAVLEDPSDDILVDKKTWAIRVKEGSERHSKAVHKAELLKKAGVESLGELFGLSELQTFYSYIYSKIGSVPEMTNEDVLDHSPYNQFIQSFVAEFIRFKTQFSAQREIKTSDSKTFTLSQGGLTPQFYIDAVRVGADTNPKLRGLIKDGYLQDEVVFRGGKSPDRVQEEDVLRLFTEPIGVGSDYKSLGLNSPMTTRRISRDATANTLDWYNNLIANSYLQQYHQDKAGPNDISIDTLSKLISMHIASEGITKSPFASTSFDYALSVGWAKRSMFSNSQENIQTGILYELRPPVFGGICTFSTNSTRVSDIPHVQSHLTLEWERELLIPGGVLPGMVEGVTIFDNAQRETYRARRFQNGDTECLVVLDSTQVIEGGKPRLKVYQYDANTKQFVISWAPDLMPLAEEALELGNRSESRSIIVEGDPWKKLYGGKTMDYPESMVKLSKLGVDNLDYGALYQGLMGGGGGLGKLVPENTKPKYSVNPFISIEMLKGQVQDKGQYSIISGNGEKQSLNMLLNPELKYINYHKQNSSASLVKMTELFLKEYNNNH